MSLIQEALKRQQQESEGGMTSEPPSSSMPEPPVTEAMPVMATPAPPAETPDLPAMPQPAVPPPPPRSRASSSPWFKIGGLFVAIVVILFVGGLIAAKWYFKTALEKTVSIPAVQPVAPVPGSGTPVTQAEPVAAQEVEVVEPQPVVSKTPGQVEDVPMLPPSVEPAPLDQEDAEIAKLPPAPPPAVPVPVALAPVAWPPLKLTGILSNPGAGEGAAIINNQMLSVGGQIDGVTLVEIRADGVMLKFGEETKFLKIGGVLY